MTHLPAAAVRFRALHDEHCSFVGRALRRLGAQEADVPDLSQRVFLTVFRRLPEFEGRSTLPTWLLGICRRIASAHRRVAYRRRELSVTADELEAFHALADDPAAQMERAERRAAVDVLLGRLPPVQREVLSLVGLEGVPASRAAGLLGVSLGTVRSRLRLARRRVERLAPKQR